MSDYIESALVIALKDVIEWEAALDTESGDGTLKVINPDEAINPLDYARRDRELQYRDLINASAVVTVSVELSRIWNALAPRPQLQGETNITLPLNAQDTGRVNSQAVYVTNASVPYDANATDKDMYGRDALLYEMLARACEEILEDPPIARIDSNGTAVSNTSVWATAQGAAGRNEINASAPLNRDLFRDPDLNLAERDNQVAAYVARLVDVMRNPFAFATRLYVRISGDETREAEVYTLRRTLWESGTVYEAGDEVYYKTGWYQADVQTTAVPTTVSDWTAISEPSQRVWAAEPALSGRNRIVYDVNLKTLQWTRNTRDELHVPQIFAMSIPGIVVDQTVDTLAMSPAKADAQFWRQKAGQLTYAGARIEPIDYIEFTESATGGTPQVGAASMTVPDQLKFAFSGTVEAGYEYGAALLTQPDSLVQIHGASNTAGQTGTLTGVDFTGSYAPTTSPAAPGTALPWSIALPVGTWKVTLGYTNLSGTSSGFGVRVTVSPGSPTVSGELVILEDTVPLSFVDGNGDPLTNGDIVESQELTMFSTGESQSVKVQWRYGTGAFHVRYIKFENLDATDGRYSMKAVLTDGDSPVIASSGSNASSNLDVRGKSHVPGVMPFRFKATATTATPSLALTWVDGSTLPIKVTQAQLFKYVQNDPTPLVDGFEGWKWEMLQRAITSARDGYRRSFTEFNEVDLVDFQNSDGTWDSITTEKWMAFIEVSEPRLRQLTGIASGDIVKGRTYEVIGQGRAQKITYAGSTYVAGQTFVGDGTNTTYTVIDGATLNQQGAFQKSMPADVGMPALVPNGLSLDPATGNAMMANGIKTSTPTVASLQPWMIGLGIYTAQSEFWPVVDDTVLDPSSSSSSSSHSTSSSSSSSSFSSSSSSSNSSFSSSSSSSSSSFSSSSSSFSSSSSSSDSNFSSSSSSSSSTCPTLVPFMTDYTSPSGEATASSEYVGGPPDYDVLRAWHAFNEDIEGVSILSWTPNSSEWGGDVWLKYQFASGQVVKRLSLKATWWGQMPTTISLHGSNDDSAWTLLTSGNPTGTDWTKTFTNSTSYTYYRLTCSTTGAIPQLRNVGLHAC